MVNFNPMNVSAAVFPMVDGLDSIAPHPAGPGLYTVLYTPTVAGPYDVALTLNGVAVTNDLTRGVAVAPAQEYAATTTHNLRYHITSNNHNRCNHHHHRSPTWSNCLCCITASIGTPARARESHSATSLSTFSN